MAAANYRVIQRDDDSFTVEVVRAGALPQIAAGFATEAEADACCFRIKPRQALLPPTRS